MVDNLGTEAEPRPTGQWGGGGRYTVAAQMDLVTRGAKVRTASARNWRR